MCQREPSQRHRKFNRQERGEEEDGRRVREGVRARLPNGKDRCVWTWNLTGKECFEQSAERAVPGGPGL